MPVLLPAIQQFPESRTPVKWAAFLRAHCATTPRKAPSKEYRRAASQTCPALPPLLTQAKLPRLQLQHRHLRCNRRCKHRAPSQRRCRRRCRRRRCRLCRPRRLYRLQRLHQLRQSQSGALTVLMKSEILGIRFKTQTARLKIVQVATFPHCIRRSCQVLCFALAHFCQGARSITWTSGLPSMTSTTGGTSWILGEDLLATSCPGGGSLAGLTGPRGQRRVLAPIRGAALMEELQTAAPKQRSVAR